MVAVRAADLVSPAGPGLGKNGRPALVAAGGGRIRSGDVLVFLKPVAVAPAVVRRDGRVQAGGHPADHARLLQELRDLVLAGVNAEHRGHNFRTVMVGDLDVCSIDGSLEGSADADLGGCGPGGQARAARGASPVAVIRAACSWAAMAGDCERSIGPVEPGATSEPPPSFHSP